MHKSLSPSTFLFIIVSMLCTVGANLLLKRGASHSQNNQVDLLQFINIEIFLGSIFFAMAFVMYMLVLSRLPLSLAQSIFSFQFILVILAANYLLGEAFTLTRWIGVAFNLIGIFLVIYSEK